MLNSRYNLADKILLCGLCHFLCFLKYIFGRLLCYLDDFMWIGSTFHGLQMISCELSQNILHKMIPKTNNNKHTCTRLPPLHSMPVIRRGLICLLHQLLSEFTNLIRAITYYPPANDILKLFGLNYSGIEHVPSPYGNMSAHWSFRLCTALYVRIMQTSI